MIIASDCISRAARMPNGKLEPFFTMTFKVIRSNLPAAAGPEELRSVSSEDLGAGMEPARER